MLGLNFQRTQNDKIWYMHLVCVGSYRSWDVLYFQSKGGNENWTVSIFYAQVAWMIYPWLSCSYIRLPPAWILHEKLPIVANLWPQWHTLWDMRNCSFGLAYSVKTLVNGRNLLKQLKKRLILGYACNNLERTNGQTACITLIWLCNVHPGKPYCI